MGHHSLREPDLDVDTWRARPHHRRLEQLVRDCALRGVRAPTAIYLAYLAKLAIFVGGAVLVVAATPGTGSLTDIASWWASPIVVQKFVVWTMLWEVLGLGAGSGPLASRFRPLIGGPLYWLRPGTIRLPPWPGRIAFTTGTRRTVVDVALYAAVLAIGVALLVTGDTAGAAYDTLPHAWVWALLVCLGALGLRDRTPFLAARPGIVAPMLLVFAFPPQNMIFALKLCLLALWLGAAISSLTRHAPYALSALVAAAPWNRRPDLTARLWRDRAADLRPSAAAARAAYSIAGIEIVVAVALIVSRGGWVSVTAVTVMVLYLVAVASAFPLGTAPEASAFLVYATIALFGHDARVGEATLTSLPLATLLFLVLTLPPVIGNLDPGVMSSLLSARAGSGNLASSVWLFANGSAEATFDTALVKPAPVVTAQLAQVVGAGTAELLTDQSLALRAMQLPGRALTGLLVRAVDHLSDYTARDGELVANVALGWTLGDGHLHDDRLLAAVQDRCGFEPGQLRVITVEAQPFLRGTQRYRITDAAAGKLEEGTVRVADLLRCRPWDETVPVEVTFHVLPPAQLRVFPSSARPRPGPVPPPVPVRIGCDGAKAATHPRPRPGPPAMAAPR